MNANQLPLFDQQQAGQIAKHKGKPAVEVGDGRQIVYVDNGNIERFFALAYKLEPDSPKWYYQILLLGCRVHLGGYTRLQPAAARLYRHLKRAGILQPGDTFRRLAC